MVNFTKDEEELVADFYLEHREILTSTGRAAEQNKKRNDLYTKLVRLLNAKNPDRPKTVKQVTDKIQYLQGKAKSKNAAKKKSKRQTGGGKDKTSDLTPNEAKFVNELGETVGYAGIPGAIESQGENSTIRDKALVDDDVEEEGDFFSRDINLNQSALNNSSEDLDIRLNFTKNQSASGIDSVPTKKPFALKTKKDMALDAIAKRNHLQTQVLEAQLRAADSTSAVNERMHNFLDRVEGVLSLMEDHYRKDPVIIISAQAMQVGNTGGVSEAD